MNPPGSIRCPSCGAEFEPASIAAHPQVQPIGMQFLDDGFQFNCFLFNHTAPGCGTTFTIAVEEFRALIREPAPDRVHAGRRDCGGHCLRLDDLSVCHAPCRYAPYRRLLLRMRVPNDEVRRRLAV